MRSTKITQLKKSTSDNLWAARKATIGIRKASLNLSKIKKIIMSFGITLKKKSNPKKKTNRNDVFYRKKYVKPINHISIMITLRKFRCRRKGFLFIFQSLHFWVCSMASTKTIIDPNLCSCLCSLRVSCKLKSLGFRISLLVYERMTSFNWNLWDFHLKLHRIWILQLFWCFSWVF